jgi:hypothetical protein
MTVRRVLTDENPELLIEVTSVLAAMGQGDLLVIDAPVRSGQPYPVPADVREMIYASARVRGVTVSFFSRCLDAPNPELCDRPICIIQGDWASCSSGGSDRSYQTI